MVRRKLSFLARGVFERDNFSYEVQVHYFLNLFFEGHLHFFLWVTPYK